MRLRARWITATFFAAAAVAIFLPMTGWVPQLVYRNTTDSMARGFYVFSHRPPAARGEVVVFLEPEHFQGWWLLKRVVGVAGDLYCWDGDRHRINGHLMPPPAPEALARGIPVWKGCRTVAAGEVVAYGDNPHQSFDSRYSGPMREEKIEGVYRLVW